MRILFTAIWPTHLMPLVPLGWALRAAGHQVLVAGPADVAATGVKAGLPAMEIDETPPAGPPPVTVADRARRRVDTFLPGYRAAAEAFEPDLVVTDPLEWNALIVGGLLGVPVVHVRFGPGELPDTALRAAREALRETCQRLGLAGGLPGPDLIVDPTPPGLQTQGLSPAQPVRYVVYNGPGVLPPALAAGPRPGRRRVLVFFSVDGLTDREPVVDQVETLLRACGALPRTETLVAASAWLRERLGESPALAGGSVRVIDPVPLHLLLDDCALVVHHGGHGVSGTAAVHGVPQAVVIPPMPEGPRRELLTDCAERVRACGAGRWLDDPAVLADPERITAVLAEALDDPAHRAAADRLRAGVLALPTPADLVGTLESLCKERAGADTHRGYLAHSSDDHGADGLGTALGGS
ncbi:nucleotide disphospho-sugar-binding domain-containing protein [Streptomyces sp. NPDC052396]|uniref:nucleotide disphospho-sugar-binding domain-containing protein n=1 Tax=Streptomyces sp. NPDC052396 TaxID=3365689 RepID=UPI0037D1EBF3